MKKYLLAAAALAAMLFLLSASVWEGAAAVSAGGDLPEGFYAATNSFPRNTVVDITNLETGKTIRVIVSSGLDSPGLLALLSKEAADSIGLQSRSIGRIRMIQPSDPVAFSRFNEDFYRSGDPDFDPKAVVAGEYPDLEGNSVSGAVPGTNDEAAEYAAAEAEAERAAEIAEREAAQRAAEEAAAIAAANAPEIVSIYDYSGGDPFVVSDYPSEPDYPLYDSAWAAGNAVPPVEPAPASVSNTPGVFSVPTIGALEWGKYYLQIGAYSRAKSVESEISKIEKNLPVGVQYAGSADKPIYRILIGPMDQNESGTLLQRFRGKGYKDAFIRRGN